jgi:hypothetical protein
MMLEDIEGRSVHFQPYGFALTKTTARKSHINPVWYSDISTRGGRDWPTAAVNQMITEATQRATDSNGELDQQALSEEPVFKITPFFEQMGPMRNDLPKEFWWEREWRHVDDFYIPFPSRVVATLAPAEDHESLRGDLMQRNERWAARPMLDPRWGLERMMAELAGVADDQIGPFPSAY